LEIFWWLFWGL